MRRLSTLPSPARPIGRCLRQLPAEAGTLAVLSLTRGFGTGFSRSSSSSSGDGAQGKRSRPLLWGAGLVSSASVAYASVALQQEQQSLDISLLPRRYDAEVFASFWREHPWTVRRRWFSVLRELLPLVAGGLLDRQRWRYMTQETRMESQRARAVQVREALTRLGPAFIKAGQAMSIRPDLLPAVVLKELQRLCDDCPPFAWSLAQGILEEELGTAVEAMFEVTSETGTPVPIAAASLGQVYKWRIKRASEAVGAGLEVAVKVQRPGMAEAVSLDICILRQLAGLVRMYVHNFTANRLDHVQLVDAWAAGTICELDYEAEAANQRLFRVELTKRLRGRVYVPEVIDSVSSRRVLVTEWVYGPRLADCDGETIRTLVPVGVDCFLTQMLDMGLFHADPHPGNLLVRDRQLVLLDFGLVAKIDKSSMTRLATATVHMVSGKYNALMDDLIALDFLPDDVDVAKVLPPLKAVLEQNLRSGSDARERAKNLQAISDELNAVFYEMPFNVPDYFALTTRALIVLEGIALVGNPNFELFWAAYPFALSKVRSVLGERAVVGLLSATAVRSSQRATATEKMAIRAEANSPGSTGSEGTSTVASTVLPAMPAMS